MTLGESGDPDAESPRIGVCAGVVEFPDRPDQVRGVAEVGERPLRGVTLGHVTADHDDVGDPGPRVPVEDLVDLPPVVVDAGEMRCGVEGGLELQLLDQMVGLLSGGTRGPVGHGHEARIEGSQ